MKFKRLIIRVLKKNVKIAYLRPIGLLVANVASREGENE